MYNKQLDFDFTENRKIRDEAIQLGVDGADSTVPNWSDRCYKLLTEYVKLVNEFTAEDFREYCEKVNFPIPNERRAFGGIIQAAVKRKLIRHTGKWGEMRAKNCHMSPTRIWTKL